MKAKNCDLVTKKIKTEIICLVKLSWKIHYYMESRVRVLIAIVVSGTHRLRLYYMLQEEPEDVRVYMELWKQNIYFIFFQKKRKETPSYKPESAYLLE